jgi:7-cyano-7-deazaguanine synthase in queuosine biosynthesis
MKNDDERLEELINDGWFEAGEIECPCEGTITLYQSPDGKGQAEYCPTCGLHIKS